jgi:hypothetical protein
VTRSTLPAAVALAVSAGLLLTACGGGSSDSSGKSQTSATASPTASATSSSALPSATSTAPGAPVFDLPSGITMKFEGFDSTDPTKKAVLTYATYAATAIIEFEARTYTTETANFKRFWTGLKGAEYADSIISQGKGGEVVTGYFHYYSPVVTAFSNGNLNVQYCEDQRKAYDKDSKTGKINVTTPSLSDFRQWTLSMAKSDSGEWQVYGYDWAKGEKSCEIA